MNGFMITGPPTPATPQEANEPPSPSNEDRLRPLVDRVLLHYDHYYNHKSFHARRNVYQMFSPSWTSSAEDSLIWVGGWRPSMAFLLLYSKSGSQLDARLDDLLRGVRTRDLGDLSPEQLARLDALKVRTVARERAICEKVAAAQETAVDPSVAELVHELTEGEVEKGVGDARMEEAMGAKREGLEAALAEADGLRMDALRGIVGELGPLQAVHFLIAAAEMHLRVHEWGKRKDARGD
ncbi:hypothetical protein QJS10_CPB20g01383 [Acorus calamus]|uniref:DOG1 domain-containing protein n=1 Tax=Acorus calamus TaxID=4465 RepID=A0AAV9CA71_ACOCL|nr:hypothetical protein QJS10_CPB20g01383 [Acorus calamus]